MSFIGRALLNNIRHVQKARVLSSALCCHKQPVVAVVQARMVTKAAATPLYEGKPNGRCSSIRIKALNPHLGRHVEQNGKTSELIYTVMLSCNNLISHIL